MFFSRVYPGPRSASDRARNPRTLSSPHCAVFIPIFSSRFVRAHTLDIDPQSTCVRFASVRTFSSAFFSERLILEKEARRSGAYNWVQFAGPVVAASGVRRTHSAAYNGKETRAADNATVTGSGNPLLNTQDQYLSCSLHCSRFSLQHAREISRI